MTKKKTTRPPQGPKIAPNQVLLENRSKSASRGHTLHTCSHEKRFPKTITEKTSLSRDRVQKVTSMVHNWHFE